jgi:hypothetical protein
MACSGANGVEVYRFNTQDSSPAIVVTLHESLNIIQAKFSITGALLAVVCQTMVNLIPFRDLWMVMLVFGEQMETLINTKVHLSRTLNDLIHR